MTPYQAAEYLQTGFSFNDDSEVINFKRGYNWSYLLGSDYPHGGFRDYADIEADVNGFYKHVRQLAEKKYGKLPF
jgi:hypothetical protein